MLAWHVGGPGISAPNNKGRGSLMSDHRINHMLVLATATSNTMLHEELRYSGADSQTSKQLIDFRIVLSARQKKNQEKQMGSLPGRGV